MDTNAGEFVGEERAEAWMQRIEVGEVVKIKGEELEVLRIDERTIVLKLLSASDKLEKDLSGLSTMDYEDLAYSESNRQRENMLRRQK